MPVVHDGDSEHARPRLAARAAVLFLVVLLLAPACVLGVACSHPLVLASTQHGICLYWWSAAEESAFGGVGDPSVTLPPARATSARVTRTRVIRLPAGSFIVDQW